MTNYFECWTRVATDLFAQALAGEPKLEESLPKPAMGTFGFVATISGDEQGRLTIVLENSILDTPLLGEGMDQKEGWAELLRETFEAASGELLAKTGKKCKVEGIEEVPAAAQVSQTFQLKTGDRSWQIMVRDEVRAPKPKAKPAAEAKAAAAAARPAPPPEPAATDTSLTQLSPGLELLLDVELEASLRFGCREMPLGELLELGPGDVVQLDRHVSDPVDLIVGDKIVARGDVVLVNGNFGLRVTEVSAPRKRLESIRCLF
jgi:flagellar motor switch protein FliN